MKPTLSDQRLNTELYRRPHWRDSGPAGSRAVSRLMLTRSSAIAQLLDTGTQPHPEFGFDFRVGLPRYSGLFVKFGTMIVQSSTSSTSSSKRSPGLPSRSGKCGLLLTC